ncbi:hypothetical protein V6Z11_A07G185800 [Gossypium hirsutum]
MCDASDHSIGAVIGQRIEKEPHVISYASKTLDAAQRKRKQKFDHGIKDKKGRKNLVAGHLSRIPPWKDVTLLKGDFPDESLLVAQTVFPWCEDMVNYLTIDLAHCKH